MPNMRLRSSAKGYLMPVLQALVSEGWTLSRVPAGGDIRRNRQLMILKTPQGDLRIRLFVYKVTGSGRSKPYERRIEITSTYEKGLESLEGFQDVVLGYEAGSNIYVGLDPERFEYGGPTGNASSFLDIEGLNWSRNDEILIEVRPAKLFPTGFEHQAFVKPPRLAEYFFNLNAIHAGTYQGSGGFAGAALGKRISSVLEVSEDSAGGEILELESPSKARPKREIEASIIDAYEKKDTKRLMERPLSPQQFEEIKRRCEDNGQLGEKFVLDYERKRLRRAGAPNLADQVRWISRESVNAGYDILSFEVDGTNRYIEVKSTQGVGRTIDITKLEWLTAVRENEKYYIYRVVNVRSKKPSLQQALKNPSEYERTGRITKIPTGWRIRLP
jgi:hypothetical protein